MEHPQKIALARLIAKDPEEIGYCIYVFECLDEEIRKDTKYIMCVRRPNWNHRPITIGEEGFLYYLPILAGIDKWYDGKEFVPYRYTDIQFMKFISKPQSNDKKFIM